MLAHNKIVTHLFCMNPSGKCQQIIFRSSRMQVTELIFEYNGLSMFTLRFHFYGQLL